MRLAVLRADAQANPTNPATEDEQNEKEPTREQQLELLKSQGVQSWNERRLRKPFWPKLNDVNFVGLARGSLIWGRPADIKGDERVVLRDANFANADLSGSQLAGADIRQAVFENSRLQNANLVGANLSAVRAQYADFRSADLRGANLARANLRYSNLCAAKLEGANFAWADLTGAIVDAKNLSRATVFGAKLASANISRRGSAFFIFGRHFANRLR